MSSFLEQLKYLQYESSYSPVSYYKNYKIRQSQLQNKNKLLNLYDDDTDEQQQYKKNIFKKQSFIEYVPFQRKYMDYKERVYKQIISRKRVQKFQVERVYNQEVPVQTKQTDFYAIEHVRYYLKEVIPQKKIQYVPVFKNIKKLQYIPVERKNVHYPKDLLNNNQVNYNQNPAIQSTSIKRQSQSSPVKKHMIDSIKQQQQKKSYYQDNIYQQSVLQSLMKAYSHQDSTKIQQINQQNNFINLPILSKSSLQKPQFSGLSKINYKSAESITVKDIQMQNTDRKIRVTRFK